MLGWRLILNPSKIFSSSFAFLVILFFCFFFWIKHDSLRNSMRKNGILLDGAAWHCWFEWDLWSSTESLGDPHETHSSFTGFRQANSNANTFEADKEYGQKSAEWNIKLVPSHFPWPLRRIHLNTFPSSIFLGRFTWFTRKNLIYSRHVQFPHYTNPKR